MNALTNPDLLQVGEEEMHSQVINADVDAKVSKSTAGKCVSVLLSFYLYEGRNILFLDAQFKNKSITILFCVGNKSNTYNDHDGPSVKK